MLTCMSPRLMVKVGTMPGLPRWVGSSCCKESEERWLGGLGGTQLSAGLGWP